MTCNDENLTTKADTWRITAELDIVLVVSDTSPHGDEVANDDGYDLGQGTGFCPNATEVPQVAYYRMYDYLRDKLPALIRNELSVGERYAISGRSTGSRGALVMALKNPGRYANVSAFAPIVNPGQMPWGKKALTAYLGADESTWQSWGSCALVQTSQPADAVPTLIDQGDNDPFLAGQLQPAILTKTARRKARPLTLCIRPGYSHSYCFIASFIEDYLRFHAQHLFAQIPLRRETASWRMSRPAGHVLVPTVRSDNPLP